MNKRKENWVVRFLFWLFKNRVYRYVAWRNYQIGFSGCGTTLMDKEPEFEKPWLPYPLRMKLDKAAIDFAAIKWAATWLSMIETLCEDPGLWLELPESLIEDFGLWAKVYYHQKRIHMIDEEIKRLEESQTCSN